MVEKLSKHQFEIVQYLKKGFWIQRTFDASDLSESIDLTNGEDDIMRVSSATVGALMRKGIIDEREIRTPSVHIDITLYHLK